MAVIDSNDSHDAVSGSSLLLLEDDDALRQMLEWELSEFGYRVTAVDSCQEARAVATLQDFELAPLDIGLPDGNGAELAAQLLERRPNTRIVLCSGRPGEPTSDSLTSSVIACLAKPVSISDLDAIFRHNLRLLN